ncbi:hypothetical protein SISNIDRAFT_484452 [Sistotremastrum niveocremeum HHB9708]|uniref:Uncharacterized protein n=1 Tax=Sistotremastrum niveocremeum HHB9708 TaxID=1314777 RepID=A0A164WCL5_9AGAM|nr:hypothetical protein SISNIDRAFT_484452 [Sistotremastrum niveocremeum HHB9708]
MQFKLSIAVALIASAFFVTAAPSPAPTEAPSADEPLMFAPPCFATTFPNDW